MRARVETADTGEEADGRQVCHGLKSIARGIGSAATGRDRRAAADAIVGADNIGTER
jgi:hypothetical protein